MGVHRRPVNISLSLEVIPRHYHSHKDLCLTPEIVMDVDRRDILGNIVQNRVTDPIARGKGGNGSGRHSGGRGGQGNGGHQISRGGGQVGTTEAQPGKDNGPTGDRTHCYAFPGRSEAEASDDVIAGTLLVCDCMASVLFDPGSTFSYVSSSFATGLDLYYDLLVMPIRVSTPVGDSVVVEKVYRSCLVTFVGIKTCRFYYSRDCQF